MADRDREGYILIDRNILDWKWWHRHNTLIVFLYLILKANYHDSFFDGMEVKRGQVVVTHSKISQQSKLTIQQVRTALNHLISTGEITIKRCPKYLVITIENYDRYQNITIESTNDQQSNNNHSTKNQQHPKQYITKTDKRKKKNTPLNPPTGGSPPSGGEEPGREEGRYEDIPVKHRDGTYHSFKTYAEYWDWSNQ